MWNSRRFQDGYALMHKLCIGPGVLTAPGVNTGWCADVCIVYALRGYCAAAPARDYLAPGKLPRDS